MYDLTPKNTDGMNIREEANTDKDPIGELNFGEHAKGDLIMNLVGGDRWLHITSPKIGWIAIIHNGVELSTVTVDGEPAPDEEYILHVKNGVTRKFILE